MSIGTEARRLLLVTAAYAVLTFAMALPFSLAPGSQILADVPDNHLYLWTMAWDAHAFLRQPLLIFDAPIYHPYSNTLAYSENLIGTAFLAAPLLWLTGNLLLATNLAALLTCLLCGVGGYVLARRWSLSPGAAFLCGLVFAFAPPRFIRLGQLHMTAIQWIPFTLAFLHGYLEQGRRRDLLLAVGCFTLQVLSSGHGAVFLVIAVALQLAWRLIWGQAFAWRQWLTDFGVAGAYLAAPAVWVLLPYQMAQTDAGLRREYPEEAVPGLASFLASPARSHVTLQQWLFGRPLNDEAIAFLFPGVLVLLLAAAALLVWRPRDRAAWRREPTGYFAALGVVSALMFVPGPLDLWRWIYWLPGFNFIRVPSRFILVVVLCLGVLAAVAFDRLTGRLASRARLAAAALVAALLLVEFSPYPFTGVPYTVEIPAIDRWLDTQPKPFVVAEVPVPSARDLSAHERHHTRVMLHATAHWQKTIHGYSGIRRPLHVQLYRDLESFPDARSVASLREVGVSHVVVHTDAYADGVWLDVERRLADHPELELLRVEGAGRVYALRAP